MVKKVFSMVICVVVLLALMVSGVNASSNLLSPIDDFEKYGADNDLIMNWPVHPDNQEGGAITLDKDSLYQGEKSICFSFDMAVKGWSTFLYYPDETTKWKIGDGIKFWAKATGPVALRFTVVLDWKSESYFINIGTEGAFYTVRFEDMEALPGNKPFDYKKFTEFCMLDMAIYSDIEKEGFQNQGKIWLDSFYFFSGDDKSTPDGEKNVAPIAFTDKTATSSATPAPSAAATPTPSETAAPTPSDVSPDSTTEAAANTSTSEVQPSSTTAEETTTVQDSSSETDIGSEKENSNVGLIIGIIAAVIILGIGTVAFVKKAKRK